MDSSKKKETKQKLVRESSYIIKMDFDTQVQLLQVLNGIKIRVFSHSLFST